MVTAHRSRTRRRWPGTGPGRCTRRRRLAGIHLQHANALVAAPARGDLAGLDVDHRAVVARANFEQAFEQGNRGGVVLGGDVELRALDHSDQVRRFHAQLAPCALADVVERIAARLHDAIDGTAARLRSREFQQGIRADAHGSLALPELDGAAAAGTHRRGQLEHGAGAHRALGAYHGDVHFALHARDHDVAGVERLRRGRAEQRRAGQHGRKPIPNYMSHRELIMVITGHCPSPYSYAANPTRGAPVTM